MKCARVRGIVLMRPWFIAARIDASLRLPTGACASIATEGGTSPTVPAARVRTVLLVPHLVVCVCRLAAERYNSCACARRRELLLGRAREMPTPRTVASLPADSKA